MYDAVPFYCIVTVLLCEPPLCLHTPPPSLQVRRGPHLVQDTLVQINRAKEQDALKKPLKV